MTVASRWRRLGWSLAAVLVLASATAVIRAPRATSVDCDGPAPAAAPGTAAWTSRDNANQLCATQRQNDEVSSPAFAQTFVTASFGTDLDKQLSQLDELGRPRVTAAQLVPGATTADPYRVLTRWAPARGRVESVTFTASDGAELHGYVFEPPASVRGPYPAVVITTGSIQGYQHLYFWAAEGLAEAGYMVLTYDVQGQGVSETLPHPCDIVTPGGCPGVPFQQDYNFVQGTTDALDFLFATPDDPIRGAFNPAWRALDRVHVGVAGHSLGAYAVSQVGQKDPRVSAVVAWDNLATVAGAPLRVPALGINSEYFLNPQPTNSPPDPHLKDAAFRQLRAAGVDTMQVALRESTHLEYSYVPWILPASRLGERVAFYYTLAWFDRYLRNRPDGLRRLTATRFDRSADVHSIGAGTYDGNNVPYRIAGGRVVDRLSFLYQSAYWLDHGAVRCDNWRAGCK